MGRKRRTIRVWIGHWPRFCDRRPLAIVAQRGGARVEFRGPPYEHQAWWGSEAGKLHESLTGPHASMLHAGDAAIIAPKHDDYDAVLKLMEDA